MFGAGASYGAREPRPPLGDTLHHYVYQYLKRAWGELNALEGLIDEDGTSTCELRRKLEKLLGKDGTTFEQIVGSLLGQDDARLLLQGLNHLMAHALTPPLSYQTSPQTNDPRVDDAFVEGGDLHDEFLASRFPKESLEYVSFITLNYDCLLERAICRTYFGSDPLDGERKCLCKHVNYQLANGNSGVVEVLKSHGSINWAADELLGDGSLTDGPIPETGWFDSRGFPNYHKVDAVDDLEGHGPVVLAFFAPGKESHVNPGTLLKIRKLALERISEAEEIEIIGMHLPDISGDDPFLDEAVKIMRERMRDRECIVRYVNPSRADGERAKDYGFEVIEMNFEQYVKNRKS